MALTRILAAQTYRSMSGGSAYYFDVDVDEQGLQSIRNIITPLGPLRDSTSLPQTVLDDMATARALTEDLLGETSIDNGTVVFTGQTSWPVTFGTAMNNTNYRVTYTTTDGTALTTDNKTVNGFDVVAATTYGSATVPKTVTYVVLEKTSQASVTGASLTFAQADAGSKAVTFAAAFDSDDYRVSLSPVGFFPAWVSTQSRTGFTVVIGITLGVAQTAVVGYDVFV